MVEIQPYTKTTIKEVLLERQHSVLGLHLPYIHGLELTTR